MTLSTATPESITLTGNEPNTLCSTGENEQPVASPCINICRMDPHSGLCEGCLRTIDEIGRWSTASRADKLQILAATQRRRGTGPA